MSRRRQKSKKRINKHLKSRVVVSQSTKVAESAPLPPGVAKLDPGNTLTTTREIFIKTPTECCFDTISKQLEQPPQWDPIIVNAWPEPGVRGQIGARSRVTLDLGGKKVESQAMISRYHPDRAISWVISGKPRVREDWQLERKPRGTEVRVTLAHELDGWVIGRLIYRVMRRKRVEQDLDKMLIELKKVIEGISHDQQPTVGVKS
jgi:uncharacterized membrane protein